jgi:hypothetical protein
MVFQIADCTKAVSSNIRYCPFTSIGHFGCCLFGLNLKNPVCCMVNDAHSSLRPTHKINPRSLIPRSLRFCTEL